MNSKIALIISILISLVSCERFIEIPTPENGLISSSTFESVSTATAAMYNVYAQMSSTNEASSYNISLLTGLSGDELLNHSNDVQLVQAYTNSLNSTASLTNSIWSFGYNIIYQSNSIIEGCASSKNIPQSTKDRLTAESLFFRGYWHFLLTNLYGDIPLIVTTDYRTNSKINKLTQSKVLAAVIQDLVRSKTLVSENYLDIDNNTITEERTRINRFVVSALLSKVYLFSGDYEKANEEANIIIQKKQIYDTVQLDKVFLKNSKEAILQLAKTLPNSSNTNTQDGFGYILTAKPANSISNSSSLSPELLSAFQTGDNRKKIWIGKFTDPSTSPARDYFFPNKYKIKSSSTITEYTTVIRLAEIILIRSEARNRLKDREGALNDLNTLRKRAGLPDLSASLSESEIDEQIMQERRVELFCEGGTRWNDLKRLKKMDLIMSKVASRKGTIWDTNKQLWPIPNKDILNNQSLNQNLGYN